MEDDYSYDNDSFFSDRRQSSFCMGLDKVPVWPGTVLHLPAVVCVGNIFRCISCCMAADRYSRPDFRAGIYESNIMNGRGTKRNVPLFIWDKTSGSQTHCPAGFSILYIAGDSDLCEFRI